MKLTAVAMIAAVFTLAGCDGDDGNDGPPGPTGQAGLNCWDLNENGVKDLPDEDLNNDGVVNVDDCNALINLPGGGGEVGEAIANAKVESCSTCHAGAGEMHQAIYDGYVDGSDLALDFGTGDVSSSDNGDGTFTVTVEFTVTKGGAPLNSPGLAALDQVRFYAVQYFPDEGEYLNSCSMSIADVDPANGVYSATDTDCPYAPEATDAHVYGYIADEPLVQHEGGTGAEIPEGSHVHLYDNAANTAAAFGAAAASDGSSYVSAANVAGCERCHGTPYYKHGYRAAQVDTIPDFAACKSCHFDDREGGHVAWQWMMDDPFAWATTVEGAAEEEKYAYTANIMNDTHMSHAMEFPFPMSISNCVTCHEGKLDEILADEEFVAETCKSCHVLDGVDASPALGDEDAGEYYQAGRPPPMQWIWADRGVDALHSGQGYDLDCQQCHVQGGVAGQARFSDLHSGYWADVYDENGEKYADQYTVSIDNVNLDGDVMAIRFSANDDRIVPEVLVSLYGWDSKDFYIASHTYDGSENCPGGRSSACRMEYVPESAGGDPNALFTEGANSTAGAWIVRLDFSAFVPTVTDDIPTLIADGVIRKAEVTVTPELELDDGTEVSLDAATQTVDIGDGAFVDNYYKGANAIVDTEKCNACHEQLAVTFHDGSGRSPGGQSIVVCRNCHNPTFDGSHLEMASRSIDNYVHAIHTFQDFDTDDIFAEFDPVEAARYEQHIKHVFPNFTIRNCEACHVSAEDGGVKYNVPDQSKSMPGVLSASYDVATWYTVDEDGLVQEASGRNIPGNISAHATGPASRACGACHRGRFINQDEAGALQSFNAHTQAFGTYVNAETEDDEGESDVNDNIVYGVIDKIMTMFD
jgi:OmcA/MtrC family decaheme c-type cytochrome